MWSFGARRKIRDFVLQFQSNFDAEWNGGYTRNLRHVLEHFPFSELFFVAA